MVLLAAALVTPRPSNRTELPLPKTDRIALHRLARQSRELSERAFLHPLPYEVRAVGHALRRFGRADDTQALERQHERIVEAAARAREQHGDEPLLVLRAVQTRLFVHAVRRWQAEAATNADLIDLGGTFARDAERRGWIRGPELAFSAAELAALFRIRWTKLVGLEQTPPFAPTVHDWRAYYRSLLTAADHEQPAATESPEELLELISAARRHAPEYPAAFARGIVYFRYRDYRRAASLFRHYLHTEPHGRWTLRAQNHLAAALARSPAAGEARRDTPSSSTW